MARRITWRKIQDLGVYYDVQPSRYLHAFGRAGVLRAGIARHDQRGRHRPDRRRRGGRQGRCHRGPHGDQGADRLRFRRPVYAAVPRQRTIRPVRLGAGIQRIRPQGNPGRRGRPPGDRYPPRNRRHRHHGGNHRGCAAPQHGQCVHRPGHHHQAGRRYSAQRRHAAHGAAVRDRRHRHRHADPGAPLRPRRPVRVQYCGHSVADERTPGGRRAGRDLGRPRRL